MFRKGEKKGGDHSAFFRIKVGQIVLALVAVLGIASLAGWSIYSSSPHQVEKLAILSESNDAASLAYSQRESFNVALMLEKWVRGNANVRDIEITRALLGQRLQVRLVDGRAAYEIMTSAYRRNLAVIDAFIIQQRKVPDSNRIRAFEVIEPEYDAFLSETRRMSKTIQQESLLQVNKVVASRTRSEFYQSAILISVILISLFLAYWVGRDINGAFRRSRRILGDEQDKLVLAIEMLDLSRAMDSFQKYALDIMLEDKSHLDFARLFEAELARLLTGAKLTVRHIGDKYLLVRSQSSVLSDEMFDFCNARFNEIMRQHVARTRLHFEAQYRAHHDLMTGLMNERGFAAYSLEFQPTRSAHYAAIFIDVDRFHRINDSMGFKFGDSILIQVAQRLQAMAGPNDQVVRLSSDEFLFLCECADEEEARSKALQVQSDLQFSATNDGIELNVTFTVGLVPYKPTEVTSNELLHQGALALNMAQQQLRNGFAIYSSDQSQEFVESLAEEFALRKAIKLSEFELYFQPVVEIATQEVTGGESLIRWNRPGYGMVYPDEFLPMIRDLQLHVELGNWVIENALRMIKNAKLFENEFQMAEFKVGINIDSEQLKLSDFADNLIADVAKNNIRPSEVSIEVTEHALVEGDIAFEQLQKLKNAGFVIAIDDFGTGYSSLSQIHSLPVTVLKIDKSFLIAAPGKSIDRQLVMDIKQLADNLNVRVLAEGVETQEIADWLIEAGITRHQGYFYSHPLPEKEFWNWVRNFYAKRNAPR